MVSTIIWTSALPTKEMAKIQYKTKKNRVNTPATPEEIFSFTDANEIKDSVNALYQIIDEDFTYVTAENNTLSI